MEHTWNVLSLAVSKISGKCSKCSMFFPIYIKKNNKRKKK